MSEERKVLSLEELQQVYLELLHEFDRICRDNHLRYDLCGGSMLGAVRHDGPPPAPGGSLPPPGFGRKRLISPPHGPAVRRFMRPFHRQEESL